jgi:Zn-dependent protease
VEILIKLAALALAIILHEVAHGYAAWRLGDPTAKMANRLTLNPMAHIDPFGSIILPLILVVTHSPVLLGWAKPVPFNPSYFRDPRKGIMIVGAAGPLTNFALAVASGVLVHLAVPLSQSLAFFLAYFCLTNVLLGVFNLIPIPPLDGSRVVLGVIPDEWVPGYLQMERFGFIIIFALLWMGALDYVMDPVANLMLRVLLGGP